jgi:hypothetical protein
VGVETSVSFPAVGKNLCPDISTWESGYTNNTGGINPANSTRLEKYSDYIPVDELENYTFSYNADGITEQLWTCICAYDENKEYLIRHTSNSNFVSRKLIAGTRFVRLSCRTYGMTTEAQFEKSAEPTAYEPFDNTIYGGYVDLVAGEVVAEYYTFTLDGTNNKLHSGGTINNGNECEVYEYFGQGTLSNIPRGRGTSYTQLYSNLLPTKRSVSGLGEVVQADDVVNYIRIQLYAETIGVASDATRTEVIDAINTWLTAHPMQVCYPLETPIHYSLTPQSIATLRGNNVMWSDANGDITVRYWTR